MTRKNRREERKRRRREKLEKDPYEKVIESILDKERVAGVTEEGYHFIRPSWHRFVYGGGKQKP